MPRSKLPLTFWITALIAFINAVSFTILIPVLYPFAKQFDLNDFQASLLTTSYAISQFFATPVLGRLSDVMGRKPLLMLSLLGTVIANTVASLAPVAWLLFAARILDGLTGGNSSIATAIISDITPPQERARAFGWYDAAFRSGFIMGPAISYVMQLVPPIPGVSRLGMSFMASAMMAFIALLLTLIWLPETLPQRQTLKLNWQIFGLAKIVQSLGRPRLGRAFLLTFLSGFTFTIFAFAFQPFFIKVLKQDARNLAILFTFIGVVGVITQIFMVGRLTKRFNLANLLAGSIGIRAGVFMLIPLVPSVPGFLALAATLGMANSFPMPLLNSILSLNSDETEQGEVLGINSSFLSISNALGPAFAGILVSISYQTPFWVAGVLTFLTAWFALSLKSVVTCESKPKPAG
jgi:predicted MFS family arabinose efflux permease